MLDGVDDTLNFSVGEEAGGDAHMEDLDNAFLSWSSKLMSLPDSMFCTNCSVLALLAMVSLSLSDDALAPDSV